jgi:hypothetical protein
VVVAPYPSSGLSKVDAASAKKFLFGFKKVERFFYPNHFESQTTARIIMNSGCAGGACGLQSALSGLEAACVPKRAK